MENSDHADGGAGGESAALAMLPELLASLSALQTRSYETIRAQQCLEIQTEQHMTNDLVTLTEERTLQINGLTFRLNLRTFVVVLLLCKAARALAGASTAPARSGFLTAQAIVERIDRMRESEPGLLAPWDTPTREEVRIAIHKLRERIARVGGNPNVFETGVRGLGYRLSTPARNILIVPPAPGTEI